MHLPHFLHTVVSVALGQDHTLALTTAGEVFSWGLNRFSQLGYILDTPTGRESLGRIEEPIQSTPRRVQAALRKVVVRGVAASRSASACWTEQDVYTWGTNNGQLGVLLLHFLTLTRLTRLPTSQYRLPKDIRPSSSSSYSLLGDTARPLYLADCELL